MKGKQQGELWWGVDLVRHLRAVQVSRVFHDLRVVAVVSVCDDWVKDVSKHLRVAVTAVNMGVQMNCPQQN